VRGHLIVFEGLDQSGKQTQAERLRDHLVSLQHSVRLVSFPDYSTHIGAEIGRALAGEREFGPDVMQLLYVANRYEWRPTLEQLLADECWVVSDRYLASSVAYGEAFGLDRQWLFDIQRFLPAPSLTILLDIAPETAVGRKSADRDRYERDLALQRRVRDNYQRLATGPGWVRINGEQPRDVVAADVLTALTSRLAPQ
jgi:dTMP kinase